MRLIFPVAALVGVIVLTGCTHTSSQHGKGPSAGSNYSLSFDQVREAAQDGDADAQYALGYMYYYGQNVTRNGHQARFWIGRAASQHHKQAMRALKMMDSDSPVVQHQSGYSEVAQSSGVRRSGEGWQEVRRTQDKVSQSEPVRSVVFTKQQSVPTGSTRTSVRSENKEFSQHSPHHRTALHKKSSSKQWTHNTRTSATRSADFRSAQEKNTRPNHHKLSKNNAAHRTTDTHHKHSKSVGASKGQQHWSADERSIIATSSSRYTLQLFGTGSKNAVQRLIQQHHIGHKAKVYQTKKSGKDFYVLIYGSYPSKAAANAEIARLPAGIQKLKPWAKSYSAVKSSIQLSSSQQATSRKG